MAETKVEILTDASGDFAAEVPVHGTLHTIIVGQNTLDTGWTLRVRDLVPGEDVLLKPAVNQARGVTYRVRVPVHDTAGAAISGAYTAPHVSGSAEVRVTGGGNAKTGTIILVRDS